MMNEQEVNQILRSHAQEIDRQFCQLVPNRPVPQQHIYDAMHYSFLGGGKRIRGALVLEFYRVCGGSDPQKVLSAACAIEMLHCYSLIHDDLPAMDNADLRRGKPSCHKAFPEALAILAGDALLTHSFEALCRCDLPDATRLSMIRQLANAGGTEGMIGGQVLDIETEGKPTDLAAVSRLQELKTGALLAASCRIGAVAAGAQEKTADLCGRYGALIGKAFQILDDILNVESDEKTMGKPVRNDEADQKATFLTLLGRDGAYRLAEDVTSQAIELLPQIAGNYDPFLCGLAKMLLNRKH